MEIGNPIWILIFNLVVVCFHQNMKIVKTAKRGMTMAITKVQTRYGTLVGVSCNGGTVFKGVPFAKPPVGERRFMAPQEPDPWEGELICDSWKNAPIHLRRIFFPDGRVHEAKSGVLGDSEDCLYLNIWTPAETGEEKLPVLLWIFGGGFGSGSGVSPIFDGEEINKRGVILVTINYRLGALGFAALPEFKERDPAHANGNYGLLDQIAALKWVHDNISGFGGDPERVTVFGQSAGGMSCKFLTVSPLARGLFTGAVIQSGGGLNGGDPTPSLEEMYDVTEKTMEKLGWTVDDLLTRDAVEVNEQLYETATTLPGRSCDLHFKPFVDGEVLPDIPEEMLKRGEYNPVNIICGSVTGDSGMFCRFAEPKVNRDDEELFGAFSLTPQYSLGRHFVRTSQKPIRAYYFTADQHDGRGTPHGSEIAYIFGTLAKKSTVVLPVDEMLSAMMTDYWTNFAKTGDPNGDWLPYWPVFDERERVLHMSDEGTMAENVLKTKRASKLIDFTIEHPGILWSMEGFEEDIN